MKEDLSVCLIQTHLKWENKAVNLKKFDEHISRIEKGAVDLILLPEMFNTGFSINPDLAEEMWGKSVDFLQEKSASTDAVIMATLLIKDDSEEEFLDLTYNRLICVYPDGKLEYYDKRHLFCLSDENKLLEKGTKDLIVDVKGWLIKPLICYDLRFPVWSNNTLKDNFDYDMLVYLANWPAVRDNHWETLLKARAIENQSYVVGLNRIGKDGRGIEHCGNSMFVDYDGTSVNVDKDCEVFMVHTFNYNKLKEYRESFPVSKDWDKFIILT